jgi:hypothetical protein
MATGEFLRKCRLGGAVDFAFTGGASVLDRSQLRIVGYMTLGRCCASSILRLILARKNPFLGKKKKFSNAESMVLIRILQEETMASLVACGIRKN